MKLFDKFLSALKTDRNTFFTFIFTLLTAYILVDRIVELIFLCFTGMSVNYWGPITYTFALACPVFAFAFSYPSKFAKSDQLRLSFFYAFCVALFIVAISMFIQWFNMLAWMGIMSLPNSNAFLATFADATKRAFSLMPIYVLLITSYKLFFWLYKIINDPIYPSTYKDSILDYTGIDITSAPENSGPYSFEVTLCTDKSTGKPVKLLEKRRFESTLIVGPSGTGKSALVLEPMMARDLEKKYFLREASKEMGYNALKSGLAVLDCPYDKNYLNKNFRLDMIKPVSGREKAYKAYMKKLIYGTMPDGSIVCKNLGLTSLTPDQEQTYRIADVAKNFGIPVHIVDPLDTNSPGLNPFTLPSPSLAGLMISLILEGLYNASSATAELVYMKDLAYQAIQNICVFLGEMYPRNNNGDLPNLEDLLHCLTDFDLVENLCEDLKSDPDLAKKYEFQIAYFEQHFYKNSTGRKDMQRYMHFATAQLEELLRAACIRDIICKRRNNLNFNEILENGEIILICTRPADIGGTAHQGLGRFFLTLLMCAIEGRPGSEKTRIPHFIYIDEFDKYACPLFTDMFTLYRKFKVGTVFTTQNLSSLGDTHSPFMQSLLSNCPTKITFGNCTPEDYGWWEKEFGQRREWVVDNKYNRKSPEYSSDLGNVNWAWKDIMSVAKIQGLKFKNCIYKTKDKKGKNVVNYGIVDFLESKYKEPHKIKNFNFDKFNNGITHEETKKTKKQRFNPTSVDFDDEDANIDPVQTDTTDSAFLFNNEDAISFDFNKKES